MPYLKSAVVRTTSADGFIPNSADSNYSKKDPINYGPVLVLLQPDVGQSHQRILFLLN